MWKMLARKKREVDFVIHFMLLNRLSKWGGSPGLDEIIGAKKDVKT